MPFLSLMTLTFKLIQARTKHVFHVNFAQIPSAVPEIFHTQTKNTRLTAPKSEPSAVHCRSLRAVKTNGTKNMLYDEVTTSVTRVADTDGHFEVDVGKR